MAGTVLVRDGVGAASGMVIVRNNLTAGSGMILVRDEVTAAAGTVWVQAATALWLAAVIVIMSIGVISTLGLVVVIFPVEREDVI